MGTRSSYHPAAVTQIRSTGRGSKTGDGKKFVEFTLGTEIKPTHSLILWLDI
ncbi:MAG: hypothetical protein LUQ50_00250 [Methanospirillum sp.]|uniref:hypothetical protein n=1 Tax=Methanospirillum sp. TaxID=45200 RepID=UPI00236C54F0|nr:hypothetical protein [Methanospirillum sp.]MDD1727481.1 hypothetical protein [Methanospirillum sp.]